MTVALVTGASSGIGRETAKGLAERGFTVVVAVRDLDRGAKAIGWIRERADDADLELGELDLASLDRVRAFAEWFLARHGALDVLVNNAGVMATPFERTADGFELQFGTNHLGHFLLTQLLTPALLAAAPSRIVNVSSAGHRASDIHWDDPNYEHRPYEKWEAYGQSKTANILFTVELERRLGPSGVHAYAVHPGMVATRLGRHLSPGDVEEMAQRRGATLPELRQPEEGAATSVWAATSPDLDGRGGLYLADEAVSDEVAPWAVDADAARRLWELSDHLVRTSLSEGRARRRRARPAR